MIMIKLEFEEAIKTMIKTKMEISQEEIKVLREIIMANPKNVKKRRWARIICAVMAVIMCIYTVTCFLDKAIGNSVIGLAFTIYFIWVTTVGSTFYQDTIYKKVQDKADDRLMSGVREYVFDSDGVTISSELGYSTYKWVAFQCWGVFNDYIYLKKIDNLMVLVKKSSLLKEDYEALMSLLNTYLTQEKL